MIGVSSQVLSRTLDDLGADPARAEQAYEQTTGLNFADAVFDRAEAVSAVLVAAIYPEAEAAAVFDSVPTAVRSEQGDALPVTSFQDEPWLRHSLADWLARYIEAGGQGLRSGVIESGSDRIEVRAFIFGRAGRKPCALVDMHFAETKGERREASFRLMFGQGAFTAFRPELQIDTTGLLKLGRTLAAAVRGEDWSAHETNLN